MTLLPPDEEAWLAQFFSGRNLLTWDSIQTGSAPDGWAGVVQPWIDLVARANPDLPIVLPFMENTDHVTWFGIARDAQTAIRLGQELPCIFKSNLNKSKSNLSKSEPHRPYQ